MVELKSTHPGLSIFPGRRDRIASGTGWIEGRRKIDGAEGLWRIRDQLYDLTSFVERHPGGSEWLTITRGTDITELFESHHITSKAEQMLPKYYAREAKTPRAVSLTFNETGFYKKFKARAALALQNVDYHHPTTKTNLLADSFVLSTLTFSAITAATGCPVALLLAGLSLAFTTVAAHNYFHMRDNFRMYYLDLTTMSSKEWRITHAMSHHMYPNTIWDIEIYNLEPLLNYLPQVRRPILRAISWIYSPLVWATAYYVQGLKRYIDVLFVRQKVEFRDLIPFILPSLLYVSCGDLKQAIKVWLVIIGLASFFFMMIGLNGAHHHPDIFHDGDVARTDLDWGLLEMDAVRDREAIDNSYFLVITQFGFHSLHHLLPTVDHAYLKLCLPALEETCREFGFELGSYSIPELIKGQFRQLLRTEPRENYR